MEGLKLRRVRIEHLRSLVAAAVCKQESVTDALQGCTNPQGVAIYNQAEGRRCAYRAVQVALESGNTTLLRIDAE